MNNKPLAKFYEQTNNTRQYIVDEDDLTWLLLLAKNMIKQDLYATKNSSIESNFQKSLERIEDCQDLLA